MPNRTTCETILEVLAQCEVRQIFGVVGDAINPLVDAIRRDDRFEWLHVRHEEAGAFAASAQAKLTGKLAVCAGTVGPGAIHLLNGLYDAKKDSAPVLAITGQVPRSEVGSDYHQEVNLDALFSDVCVFNQTLNSVDQLPRLIQQAVETALSRRGVAHLSIPADLGAASVEQPNELMPITRNIGESTPSLDEVRRAAELLDNAKSVAILCGCGCRDATTELLTLAERLQAPIVHALRGKDLVAYDHPLWIGGTGLLGSKPGMQAIDECEALLMVGTDFPYRDWLPHGKPVVQIDVRAEHIGKRCPVTVGLVGHARPTLAAMADCISRENDSKFLKDIQERHVHWEQSMHSESDIHRSNDLIHPQAIARIASELADENAVFCVDTGEVSVWGARHVQIRGSQRLLMSFNLASMAFAMPGALGVQALDRSRQVISFSGDGGFSMLMGDFITACNFDLPIKVIVFNNGKLGLVKMEMEVAGYPEYGTDLKNPDFAAIARTCGGGGIRVTEPGQLYDAIKTAFTTAGPFLVDVVCNGEELTMPPKIELSQAWGFSLSKIRELVLAVT